MEYRVSFTVAEYGYDPGTADRLWQELSSSLPACEPVVASSKKTGELWVSFRVEAGHEDAATAQSLAWHCVATALVETGGYPDRGLWLLETSVERSNNSKSATF